MLNFIPNGRAALSMFLSFVALAGPLRAQTTPPLPTEEFVRKELETYDPVWRPDALDNLVKLGEKSLPIHLRIANDPKTDFIMLARIFGVVKEIKGDRHQFVE